jgi:hypothetical protein
VPSADQQDLTHNATASPPLVWLPTGSTLTRDGPGRTGNGQVWAKPWPLAAKVTRWWSPSSTGLRGRCPMPEPPPTRAHPRQVRLNLGGSVYDPTDPVGRLLFNVLAMVAEFETDLIRLRTREGVRIARVKGRLRGKQPKLIHRQEAHLVALFDGGDHSTAELADLFSVTRSTVYRAVERERARAGVGVIAR